MPAGQRPLQLILARNLITSLGTPAFLTDVGGQIIFYNDAAGTLLRRTFEECGPMAASEWSATFGPFDDNGTPIPFDQLPMTIALLSDRPAHGGMRIRSLDGVEHDIVATGLPIHGDGDFHGAMVFFWPAAGPVGDTQ